MWRPNIDKKLAVDIAERIDIQARQNESLNLKLSFFDPTIGSPLDLTGYSFEFVVKSGTTVVLLRTIGTGITIATPTSGVMDIDALPLDTNFPASTYTYNLIASNGNYVKSWIAGLYYQLPQESVSQKDARENTLKTYLRVLNKDILLTVVNNN